MMLRWAVLLLLAACLADCLALRVRSRDPPDPDNCAPYGTCQLCSNQNEARCGWCATDADGGGMCIPMSGTGAPAQGYNCSDNYWDHSCCSSYSSCASCSNSNTRCQWCGKGSSVNGGKCVPYNGNGSPCLGGCDEDYYTNWCCRDLKNCEACNAPGLRCQWCFAGSKVNGGQCLPFNGQGSPMYGGCSEDYYSGWCCGKYDRCDSCLNSPDRCVWCGSNSTVNAQSCITTNGQGVPIQGGCSSDQWWEPRLLF